MLWSEFFPYVLPYVVECPAPVAEHHIRLSAIDFCRRTACYQQALDIGPTDGQAEIALTQDSGIIINKLRSLSIDGRIIPSVDAKQAAEFESSTQDYYYTQDNKILFVNPVPSSGLEVVANAVLMPSITATGLDNVVAKDYTQDIATGAIASLLRVPAQSFTDFNASAVFQAQYNARVATVAAKVARGFSAGKMRAHTSYV